MVMGPHDERRKASATSAENGSSRHSTDRILKAGIERALVVVDAAAAAGIPAFDCLEHAATRCAQDGIPIETVYAAVAQTVMSTLGRHGPTAIAVDDGRNVERAPATCASILDDLLAVVTRAYG